ncbi:MAG: glycine cleavage system protein H [Chloroflexi bacterium RBG_16_48_8]|nr:MAG: glycine cleavage system protein H [Chloroflexi bacterium RBG_16_48_8]
MEFPDDLKYTKNDEWIRVEGDSGTAGISDYAQDQLSDIVYVEVTAAIGDEVEKGEAFALVESVKAAVDVYMPVTGKITEVNEALIDTPELVNSDPYGQAWMVKFEVSDPSQLDDLMDVEAYKQSIEKRSN